MSELAKTKKNVVEPLEGENARSKVRGLFLFLFPKSGGAMRPGGTLASSREFEFQAIVSRSCQHSSKQLILNLLNTIIGIVDENIQLQHRQPM